MDGVIGELTDRIATQELRTDFECVAVVEELVLVFVDDGGVTRRHGVEGAVRKKLEDDLGPGAGILRGDLSVFDLRKPLTLISIIFIACIFFCDQTI